MQKLNNSSVEEEYLHGGTSTEGICEFKRAGVDRISCMVAVNRYSALGDGQKKQQSGLYQPFEASNA